MVRKISLGFDWQEILLITIEDSVCLWARNACIFCIYSYNYLLKLYSLQGSSPRMFHFVEPRTELLEVTPFLPLNLGRGSWIITVTSPSPPHHPDCLNVPTKGHLPNHKLIRLLLRSEEREGNVLLCFSWQSHSAAKFEHGHNGEFKFISEMGKDMLSKRLVHGGEEKKKKKGAGRLSKTLIRFPNMFVVGNPL